MNVEQLITTLVETISVYGLRIIAAIVILILGRFIAKSASKVVGKAMKRGGSDDTLIAFTSSIVRWGIVAATALAVLAKLGIQTASFVAVLAAAGLAIGMALQGTLSNFAAGFMLVIFRPFRVGDFIEGGGATGSVVEIGLFTTELKTGDNVKLIVPNSSLFSGNIKNFSAHDTRRIDLVVGIDYGDDIAKAKQVLEDILSSEPRVLEDPAPTIAVSELGASSVDLLCRPWVAASDYWPTRWDLTETIKTRFDEEGLSFPFPQTDVHLHQDQAA